MRPVCSRMLPIWVLAVGSLLPGWACAADFDTSVKAILSVGAGGKGNAAASAAVKELSQLPVSDLTRLLASFDGANPIAANWLRSVAETIAAREVKAGNKLPQDALEKFIGETSHDPRARRMAYEWLLQQDPTIADRLIPGMLNDPSTEFRRDAVARLIDTAKKQVVAEDKDAAKKTYLTALNGARDEDQINDVVKPLEEMGVKIDLPRHFGFVMDWYVIGPFDNTGKKGFNVAYPPESEVQLDKKYAGQKGEVGWSKFVTDNKYGVFDLLKFSAPHKGSAMYAYSDFVSDKDQTVDIRLGTPNAYKVWVNGDLVFGREEYHRGTKLDQYRMRARLKQGKNQILVKICQNEQTEDWAQGWQFQIRVCDATGTAILSKNRPAAPESAAVSLLEGR